MERREEGEGGEKEEGRGMGERKKNVSRGRGRRGGRGGRKWNRGYIGDRRGRRKR